MVGSAQKTDKLKNSIQTLLAAAAAANADQVQEPSSMDNNTVFERVMDRILNNDPRSADQNVARLKSCSAYFNISGVPAACNSTSMFMQGNE